ncbi:MAG: sulfurtransferase [Anaerolineales bacterium]
MPYTTLISTTELAQHLDDPQWAILDCRFDLANVEWGAQLYRAAHIPNALYAHLDHDLSGAKTGRNGRHPLPNWETFKATLGRWGVNANTQVIAYDQDTGMYASRLWWMLRYLGHRAVAVLDGGYAKWTREGRPVRADAESRAATVFTGQPAPMLLLTADEVAAHWMDSAHHLIDARAPERYRGEIEPLDRMAGHIPGAANHFYKNNLNVDGTFLAPQVLRERFQKTVGDAPVDNVAHYCGSGVSAAHNLLAMEVAGLTGAKLYAGSWSEWSSDPARPVEKD